MLGVSLLEYLWAVLNYRCYRRFHCSKMCIDEACDARRQRRNPVHIYLHRRVRSSVFVHLWPDRRCPVDKPIGGLHIKASREVTKIVINYTEKYPPTQKMKPPRLS